MRKLLITPLDLLPLWLLVLDAPRHGALEDVFLARGQVGEDLGGEVEVLGQDGLGRVRCVAGELVAMPLKRLRV
jgi:hypothetical protein